MKFLAPVLSISLVCSTNIHVPVTSDRYGHAIVDVDLSGEVPSRRSMVISLGSNIGLPSDYGLIRDGSITLTNTNISLVPALFVLSPDSTRQGRLREFGINENTDMVRRYQSVAVIKNSTHPTQLVVGITAEYFRSFCADGSLTRVSRLASGGSVAIANDTEPFDVSRVYISSDFYESALHLSSSLAERVRARLEAAGAISNGSTSFTNCTYLPEDLALTIRFDPPRYVTNYLERIALYPDDYIEHDPVANTCSFYLSTPSNSFQPTDVVFNPLLVSGLNLRTIDSCIFEICDTSL